MGVPQSDMSEMTGNVAIGHRELAWKQKRIFFMTPQVCAYNYILVENTNEFQESVSQLFYHLQGNV